MGADWSGSLLQIENTHVRQLLWELSGQDILYLIEHDPRINTFICAIKLCELHVTAF